jgi:hypothetical protein
VEILFPLNFGYCCKKTRVKAMNTPFPEVVGKVISSFEIEHSDSGSADGIKAVIVSFNDGSRIKIEFQVGIASTSMVA